MIRNGPEIINQGLLLTPRKLDALEQILDAPQLLGDLLFMCIKVTLRVPHVDSRGLQFVLCVLIRIRNDRIVGPLLLLLLLASLAGFVPDGHDVVQEAILIVKRGSVRLLDLLDTTPSRLENGMVPINR